MVYLHTGPMGVHRACFFIARAGRAATPERNRSGNQPPILCILPLVAHQLASARLFFGLELVLLEFVELKRLSWAKSGIPGAATDALDITDIGQGSILGLREEPFGGSMQQNDGREQR